MAASSTHPEALAALQAKLDDATAAHERLLADAGSESQAKLEALSAEVEAKEARIKELEAAVAEAEQQSREAQTAVQLVTAELEAKKQEVERLQSAFSAKGETATALEAVSRDRRRAWYYANPTGAGAAEGNDLEFGKAPS